MTIDPSTSPNSSAWLGLEDLSSFDSSPQLAAVKQNEFKRKAPNLQVRYTRFVHGRVCGSVLTERSP